MENLETRTFKHSNGETYVLEKRDVTNDVNFLTTGTAEQVDLYKMDKDFNRQHVGTKTILKSDGDPRLVQKNYLSGYITKGNYDGEVGSSTCFFSDTQTGKLSHKQYIANDHGIMLNCIVGADGKLVSARTIEMNPALKKVSATTQRFIRQYANLSGRMRI